MMKKWGESVPRTAWLKIMVFWIQATYWYIFIRPIEKRMQEMEEAKHYDKN